MHGIGAGSPWKLSDLTNWILYLLGEYYELVLLTLFLSCTHASTYLNIPWPVPAITQT